MSYITFDGIDALPDTGTSYLMLYQQGAIGIENLVLAEFQENPYMKVLDGVDKSDGRSLAGSIRIKGNQYAPTRLWQLSFTVNRTQADLFEAYLLAQRNGGQLKLVDMFSGDGLGTNTACYIDVDNRYLTTIAPDWLLLQFTAREEV